MSFDLASAIDERALVSFVYDGLPRVVQPATVGTTTVGRASLRACLIGGHSRSNTIPCWEMFSVSKITNPVLTGERFVTFALPGYRRSDSGFSSIFAEH